jgi:antitoxin component of MazEF toxin-antitoxin module
MPDTPSYIVTIEKDNWITLPDEIVKAAGLAIDDVVNVEYANGVITIEKVES